ncbi:MULTISPECIES: ketose-bisphosphate aldolase [Pectobacterium]|uniref:Ketose-bisphosphate aldolase n=3 Tax=Pectobacterium TaxID=122277 RepID=A0AAW3SY29_9GAMM|nr:MULTISPECIES: ketose-bisphosphate aldolase [Pectobacterium]ACT11382.1 ketose-bisphosphate aldolase [Pectobacterium carotovorum subsp. carotovorum PC1]MBA0205380.1 ketose-bisphosphate aldolase [Pectobacterium aroidearum]MBA5205431.1 ketose-bisphosphate aldolase [Pectobacterium aroidearum]MBA5238116.1 ketose-bisphosphate aldolase [Pectobacterium aroidearum]MBA5601959.1 ketose-bisphosphate aldolase [Pectobacterium aroidearum]
MLISMTDILKPTREHRFAIGAFNVADSCFIRAVVEEAEATNTPAIISIHPSELEFVTDEFFAYVRERTLRSPVPFVIHLDHGASIAHVLRAIQCGFTSVMIDGSLLPYEENVALTREVVKLAHAVGVSVEGELGTIGDTGTTIEGGVSKVIYTDPEQAEDFVNRTGVDTLAVAIGTAHGIYPKDLKPELQMHILRDISQRVSIPLVLHGGSANPDAEIAEAVTLGVGKINISSDMKFAYFQKAREILSRETWWDPNAIYPEPIKAAKEVIRYKMALFGSTGKASLYR